MLVSVVLPTFNRGYCLERAIRSVLGQTYPDWELIVVDDGSTDDTQAVLESFKDPRIRVFRHSVNRGVAAARNTGLAAARGEFIAFLDSDDEWRPDKLTKQLDVMRRAPTAQLAFTDLVWRRGDVEAGSFARTLPVFSKLLHQHPPTGGHLVIPQRTMYLCLLQELPVKSPTLMIRAQILSSVGQFDEQLRSGEDWEFLLRAAREFDFAYLDESLTVVHVLKDATHFRYFVEDKEDFIRFLLRARRSDQGDKEARAAARRGIIMLRKHLYWHYMASGDRRRATASCLRGCAETASPGLLARAIRAAALGFIALPGRRNPRPEQSD
jgi:glycosyltransferase involved in cell wall biosynthesis